MISVVVASSRRRALLEVCLTSLIPECATHEAELIVARPAVLGDLEDVRAQFPTVRVLEADASSDIPRLRGLGMAEARGDLVAVTEDHCLAQPGWLTTLAAASDNADVVGGSVGNAPGAKTVDWAAYYAEYGFFSWTRPKPGDAVPLLTGANVAYRRAVADDVARWAREGHWESVAHRRLADRGCRLRFVPDARVLQAATFRFGAFCADRYEHGLDHARVHAAEDTRVPRWFRLVGSPLLPALLLWRVYRAAGQQSQMRFLCAMPYTAAFLAAWSVGEAVGYFRGPLGPSVGRSR